MKKSVVSALAAAVILGTATTPTYAAQNPFSDVNDHHWAYNAVLGLAEAGIVTGYDNSDASLNGKFLGGRNITRYEMAQMIAKTLARIEGESSPFNVQLRGHQWTFVDNSGVRRVVDGTVVPFKLSNGATVTANELNQLRDLVEEFQVELDSLGLRVAELEKHADKVKWNGKIEYTYHNLKYDDRDKTTSNGYVFRLEPIAEINDHWTARARLDANGDMNDDTTPDVFLKRIYAQGDYDRFSVKLGRFGLYTPEEGIVNDSVISGGELTYGTKWKAILTGGRIGGGDEPEYGAENETKFIGLNVQYDDPGDKGLFGGLAYYYAKDHDFANYFYSDDGDAEKANVIGANIGYRFNDMFYVKAAAARNSKADNEKDGWDVLLRYGKYGDYAEKGDWAVWAGYSKFGYNVAIATNQSDDIQTGTKGWHIGAAYAPFKNVGILLRYAHGKDITGGDKYKKIFARAEFFF